MKLDYVRQCSTFAFEVPLSKDLLLSFQSVFLQPVFKVSRHAESSAWGHRVGRTQKRKNAAFNTHFRKKFSNKNSTIFSKKMLQEIRKCTGKLRPEQISEEGSRHNVFLVLTLTFISFHIFSYIFISFHVFLVHLNTCRQDLKTCVCMKLFWSSPCSTLVLDLFVLPFPTQLDFAQHPNA